MESTIDKERLLFLKEWNGLLDEYGNIEGVIKALQIRKIPNRYKKAKKMFLKMLRRFIWIRKNANAKGEQ